jgi:di/tricarboxylate transporter
MALTQDQIVLFVILIAVFAFLIWGRWRYDLVAFGALLIAVVSGVVPTDKAFSGFGHPATVIIALVLIISRALSITGAVDLISRFVVGGSLSLFSHVLRMSALSAALSAVMNNVAALALLMPVDIQAAKKAGRTPATTLMPLSFASILGGMITLIGTPPNIIIAAVREDTMGEPFAMFDFAPVGMACAVAGVLFVTLIGWRLVPGDRSGSGDKGGFDLEGYIAEATVPEESDLIGKKVRELDELADEIDCEVIGLFRNGRRMPGLARYVTIQAGDHLLLEGGPDDLDRFISKLNLQFEAIDDDHKKRSQSEDVVLAEVVVAPGARIARRSTRSLRLKSRFGVHLLGISRQGKRLQQRIRHTVIEPGDVLLLHGKAEELPDVIKWIGCLPLAERGLQSGQRQKAWITMGIFAVAIALAATGLLYLPIALALAAVVIVLLNIVPLREVYDSVEWPVIVLLGSMIPIGAALEETGGTAVITSGILILAQGYSAIVVLTLLMVATMTLSDVMNNAATAVIAAPIAIDLAGRLGVNADPFLMAVAVAASCAFLTPIGHKNNTLILGPGGYRFGDYWRMGLPLEILIVLVSIPMIVWVWPL